MNKIQTPSKEQMQKDFIEDQLVEYKKVRKAYIVLKQIYENISPQMLEDIEFARAQYDEAKERSHCFGLNDILHLTVKSQIESASTQYELAVKRHYYITHTLDLLFRCSTVKGFLSINRYFLYNMPPDYPRKVLETIKHFQPDSK